MFDYIHITQGRLRVRIASVKGNGAGARKLYLALRRIRGVRSVEINLLTGSVLILHDGAGSTSEAVAHDLGLFAQPALAAAMVNPGINQGPRTGAGFFMSQIAESALERLVTASVSALL